MKHSFNINHKSFSINAVHCRDKRYKTKEYQDWSRTVIHLMANKEDELKFEELRKHFKPEKHCFHVELKSYYPESKLYTQKGSISNRIHDLSNIEKVIIDLMFLKEYHGDNPPYSFKNLCIDDRYITKLTSEKLLSENDTYNMNMTIEVVDLDYQKHSKS